MITQMANRIFARSAQNKLVEIIIELDNIDNEWHPDILATFDEITGVNPKPQVGWVRTTDGSYAPPTPFVLNPEQQMRAALVAGCQIHYLNALSLNATYAATGTSWQNMRDITLYVATFDAFPEDLAEFEWTALSGEVTFTTIAQFKAVTRAINDWISGWRRYVESKSDTPPTSPVVIT